MEKAYLDKLEKVLSHLSHQKSLRLDDTCLQKLLDNIRNLRKNTPETKSNDGCLSDMDIFQRFLDDVDVTQEGVDESVKVFAVRLFGIIGEDEEAFKHFLSSGLVTRFYGGLSSKLMCQDLSVLSAVFVCLRGLLSHKLGLTWFLQTASDFCHIAFDVLKSGKSLFVISSAQEFITELWGRAKNLALSEETVSESNTVLKQIHQELWTMIEAPVKDSIMIASLGDESSVSPDQGCLSALEVLKQIYERTEDGFHLEREKFDVLMKCLLHKPSSAMVIVDIVQQWYSNTEGPVADDLEKTIISIVHRLLDEKRVDTALTMAQTFCFRFSPGNREWLQELSLLPIQGVMCTQLSNFPHGQVVLSHMQGRRSFTQALSAAITCAAQVDDKAMSAVICDIVKILHNTLNRCLSSHALVVKQLQQNTVLQRIALETIKHFIDRRRASGIFDLNLVTQISKCLLEVTEDSQTPVQILMVLFRTWTSLLNLYCGHEPDVKAPADTKGHNFASHTKGDNSDGSSCANSGCDSTNVTMDSVLDSLSFCVEKKMCDLQWEIRDTAVEFLTGLMNSEGGCGMEQWILSNRLHISLWQCVRDQESYVRASALKSVSPMVESRSLWQGLQQHIPTTELVRRVVDIVRNDSEAFPRRAGVDLLSVLFSHVSPVNHGVILTTLQLAVTKDFDWDVQVKALNFWEKFVEQEMKGMLHNTEADGHLPNYAAGLGGIQTGQKRKSPDEACVVQLLEKFQKTGVLTVLLSALQDCDQSVGEKACQILIAMKHTFTASLNQAIIESTKKPKCDQDITVVAETGGNGTNTYVCAPSVETFISMLNDHDLHKKLSVISQSSDEYMRNPMSLLEDILNSLSDDQNEDNIIDCY
ncbi:BRCA1-associated ATM activator 1-like [Liolophura sinensis]|uniref:BRCA1-associated ATM activator 1-like n=1 Tax=Liolophura sinensis TaxID=3198878 RepID=UPI003158A7AE